MTQNNPNSPLQSWLFKKNCSFTPKQVLLFYIAQSTFSLLVAGGFLIQGIWQVLPFTALELIVLAIALLIYARHATDYEAITLYQDELIIQTSYAGKPQELHWNPSWVQLGKILTKNKLIEIKYQGKQLELGQFLHVSLRENFLHDLKQSLRQRY
jgi:uncharacterized membrane protein